MSRPPCLPGRPAAAPGAESEREDARLHRRFALPLAGRFMGTDKTDHPCRLRDISIGGVAISFDQPSAVGLRIGDRVVAYVNQLGGLEGPVVEIWEDGFAFKLNATQHKREKLAAQITWLLNEDDFNGAAKRRNERIRVRNRSSHLALSGGVELPCLILDVSASGASVACDVRPDIDTEIQLGRVRGHVVRHHHEGVGLQFREPLDADTLQVYFG